MRRTEKAPREVVLSTAGNALQYTAMASGGFRQYQIVRKLASGGMAEIFLARVQGEGGFSRTCVIKKMHPYLTARPGSMELFLGEAQLAARLLHPGIAQILDVGREGDDFFIVLEHLDGKDLSAVLWRCAQKGVSMPIDLALKIAASAAEALHYAHELRDEQGQPMNIVHRDVSPSNLFLTFQGSVKLLDFGIAQASSRLDEGSVKGKVAYMAPEQTFGGGDRRVDVWALGVCLHEMLTGERLFVGADWNATCQAVREARIPLPSETRTDVPEEVDAMVMAALERDPSRRLPTAAALAERVERALRNRSYISPASQTGAFLSHLFERESEERRPDDAMPTLDIVTLGTADVERVRTTKTLSVSSEAPRPSRSWRRWAVVAGALASVLLAVAAVNQLRAVDSARPAQQLASASTRSGVAAERADIPPGVSRPNPLSTDAAVPGNPDEALVDVPKAVRADDPTVELATTPTRVSEPTENAKTPRAASPKPKVGVAWVFLSSNRTVNVWLDGVSLGKTPLQRVSVASGLRRLKLEHGGRSRSIALNLRAGEVVSRKETIRDSRLNVSVEPWAYVYLDEVKMGVTPLSLEAWDGEHELKLVGPGNATKTLKIKLSPEQPLTVRERL